MLPTTTAQGMRSIEQEIFTSIGIPSCILMERAALELAREARAMAGEGGSALFLCGGGNNGGDGLAAARLLTLSGGRAHIVMTTDPERFKGDALLNYQIARNMGLTFHDGVESAPPCALIVDAVIGTGLTRAPEGMPLEVIRFMNNSGIPVLSADIPSGVDADTGRTPGEAVRAARTLAFGYLKQGEALFPGRTLCGEIRVCDIGMPKTVLQPDGAPIFEDADVRTLCPPRETDAHKGTFGHAGIIAGSRGMAGAASICTRAALRAGAGLVSCLCDTHVLPVVQTLAPEAMCRPVEDTSVEDFVRGKSVVAIGPGLGLGKSARRLMDDVLEHAVCPLVVDADALTLLPRKKLGMEDVLTPHVGELSRMTGASIMGILDDPIGAALEAARFYGAVVLLKGATTVVASPEGRVCLDTAGTPGMAKGGSGDALTGVVAALIGQGLSAFDAAITAAHVHGRAGERACTTRDERSMTAMDLVDAIRIG